MSVFDEIMLIQEAAQCGGKVKGCNKSEDCCDIDPADDDLTEGAEGGICQEDPEGDALIIEAAICEAIGTKEGLQEFLECEAPLFVKMGILTERSIVRLDKKAKLSKAEAQAVFIIAKEKGDRDYKKLCTIWKMRKVLIEKLTKKYANEARRRAKTMVKKSQSVAGATAAKL